jgi:hypothetical protein
MDKVLSKYKRSYEMGKYYIITFNNTHGAISAESVLKETGIKNIIMPTPTFITKSCGLSLKVENDDIEKIKELIQNDKITAKGIYLKDGSNYQSIALSGEQNGKI